MTDLTRFSIEALLAWIASVDDDGLRSSTSEELRRRFDVLEQERDEARRDWKIESAEDDAIIDALEARVVELEEALRGCRHHRYFSSVVENIVVKALAEEATRERESGLLSLLLRLRGGATTDG